MAETTEGETTTPSWLGPGWRARHRPLPQLGHLLGAAGGALAVLGPIVYGGDSTADDGSGTTGAVLCLLAVVAALVAMRWVPGPVRAACTSVVAVGIPAFWIFLLLADSSPADPTTVFAVVLLSYAVAWIAGPARGRGVLLALALLVAWSWVTTEVGEYDNGESFTARDHGSVIGGDPDHVPGIFVTGAWPTRVKPAGFDSDTDSDVNCRFDEDGDYVCEDGSGDLDVETEFDTEFDTEIAPDFDELDEVSSPFGPKGGEVGIASLIVGFLYLAGAVLSDRRLLLGLAGPLAGVGLTAALSGSIVLGIDSETIWFTGVLLALVALVVAVVGARGGHRATTWWGAAGVAVGIGLVCGDLADDSATTFSLLAILAGAAITAFGLASTVWWPERDDGDPEAPLPGPRVPELTERG